MNILLIGGAGFIGHHTANALARAGHKVRVMDILCPKVHMDPRESIERLDSSVQFVSGDVRRHEDLLNALNGIDVVYHFAAETGVGQSMYEMDRYVDVNVRGTAVLCECIANLPQKISKLILASSRAVYGEGSYLCKQCGKIFIDRPRSKEDLQSSKWEFYCSKCCRTLNPQPIDEDAPPNPISVYGITKRTQEELCSTLSLTFKVSTVILRYFNVFGSGQCLSNPYTGIASTFCNLMFSNKPIEIYEDGAMLRDFVHVYDVVQANEKVLLLDNSGVIKINIGSGDELTVLQLAKLLKSEIGSHSTIKISGRYRVGDIRHSLANISRAKEIINYKPRISPVEGLKDLIEWARHRWCDSTSVDRSIQELSDLGLTGVAGKKSPNSSLQDETVP